MMKPVYSIPRLEDVQRLSDEYRKCAGRPHERRCSHGRPYFPRFSKAVGLVVSCSLERGAAPLFDVLVRGVAFCPEDRGGPARWGEKARKFIHKVCIFMIYGSFQGAVCDFDHPVVVAIYGHMVPLWNAV